MKLYRTIPFQRQCYPALTWKVESEDTIYLTFDDGPTEGITHWVLDELDRVDGKATFFCVGQQLKKNRSITEETIKRGHAIGNHGYEHLNGWKTQLKTYVKDIERCDEQLGELDLETGLFRPPYGKITARQIRALNSKKIIMWSFIAWDFSNTFRVPNVVKALMKAKAGDIVLFHDSQKAHKNLKQVLPELLNYYRMQGLQLGTLS